MADAALSHHSVYIFLCSKHIFAQCMYAVWLVVLLKCCLKATYAHLIYLIQPGYELLGAALHDQQFQVFFECML